MIGRANQRTDAAFLNAQFFQEGLRPLPLKIDRVNFQFAR
jgi:hypothetical protein